MTYRAQLTKVGRVRQIWWLKPGRHQGRHGGGYVGVQRQRWPGLIEKIKLRTSTDRTTEGHLYIFKILQLQEIFLGATNRQSKAECS